MKALQGVLFVLLVIGSLVYAVYAQVPEPPLEPAYTFMRWQALYIPIPRRREHRPGIWQYSLGQCSGICGHGVLHLAK
jgi:hypothetical protein